MNRSTRTGILSAGVLLIVSLIFMRAATRPVPTGYVMKAVLLPQNGYTISILNSRKLNVLTETRSRGRRVTTRPRDGRTFLVCKVAVHNKTAHSFTPGMCRLTANDGKRYGVVGRSAVEVQAVPAPIGAGHTATGELVFEVPANTRPVKIDRYVIGCFATTAPAFKALWQRVSS